MARILETAGKIFSLTHPTFEQSKSDTSPFPFLISDFSSFLFPSLDWQRHPKRGVCIYRCDFSFLVRGSRTGCIEESGEAALFSFDCRSSESLLRKTRARAGAPLINAGTRLIRAEGIDGERETVA